MPYLLAQKAFSMYHVYPLIENIWMARRRAGLHEARLGYEEMGKENHIFSPAYKEEEIQEILRLCDHMCSIPRPSSGSIGSGSGHADAGMTVRASLWLQEICMASALAAEHGASINPECSTQEGHAIYDPCAPFSRLGTTLEQMQAELTEEEISELDGLHFHTLCEQNSDDLATTLRAVRGEIREISPSDEMGELRRRTSYHEEGLRP